MNKDDFDIFRHLKQCKSHSALDLLKGLENREYGNLKNKIKSKENVELYAEEQLVDKQSLDEMRCEMPGLPRSTFLMVFSPDGQRAASTHGNHNIYVTDLRSGKNIKTLVGHPRTPWCIAFHPTSDQIVASGCLGGQVRIWDLSGGSEVWTSSGQSVIASIAFHPNDRILVIATFNEVYFWDWSRPEPFVSTATNNPKEKVRYVAFDKLGHKLITGIANGPQTRWERVRAPVPVPRQERCASPYRRRITQRLVTSVNPPNSQPFNHQNNTQERQSSSGVPERERRIMLSYRNLVREYEQLVHRYLQLYRPPTMIDRGTDPMEPNLLSSSGTQTLERTFDPAVPGPSGIGRQNNTTRTEIDTNSSEPSTSRSVISPSRMLQVIKKPNTLIRGTQTSESRKHKAEANDRDNSNEKRFKKGNNNHSSQTGSTNNPSSSNEPVPLNRVLVVNLERLSPSPRAGDSEVPGNVLDNREDGSSNQSVPPTNSIMDHPLDHWGDPSQEQPTVRSELSNLSSTGPSNGTTQSNSGPTNRYSQRFSEYIRTSQQRIAYIRKRYQNIIDNDQTSRDDTEGGSSSSNNVENNDLGSTASFNPSEPSTSGLSSAHQQNVDELLSNIRRTAEEEVRNRILPIIRSVPVHDRPELIRLFENSREHVRMRFRQMCPIFLKRHGRRLRIDTSTDSSSSDNDQDESHSTDNRSARRNSEPGPAQPNPQNVAGSSNVSGVRNFNTELEQLVTSLLTEIERNDVESSSRSRNVTNASTSPISSAARTRPSHFPAPYPSQQFLDELGQSSSQQPDSDTTQAVPQRDPPPAFVNTNTRTTNSTIYTSNTNPSRRRFFLHRVSAFMPTRVNYNARSSTRYRRSPHYPWGSGRSGLQRNPNATSFALDELINYAERENSEDDPPPPNYHPFDVPPEIPSINPENFGIGNMYSNIIQDLESSLSDVRNIRASNRPGETSDMLSSFSERLENIMNQSDTILRNLRSSMDMLPTSAETNRSPDEPRWNFNDAGFYVRDLRNEQTDSGSNLHELFVPLNAVATDHTYPRNPNVSPNNDNMSPLMTSLHLTITHIQQQARLLRRQVESIERIDRAMVEVAQLQLMRQLIIDLVRHIRNLCGENRSTGMSSVRQMMAGTRISDSSPYDSPNEEPAPATGEAGTSSQNTGVDMPGTSTGTQSRPRSSNRKTYPPSRLFRLPRHYQRRPSIVHWVSRRYLNRFERGVRQNVQSRSSNTRSSTTNATSESQVFNYANVNASTLSLMTARLERLLTEQMRVFTRPQDAPPSTRSTTSVDLGEHILALRLHGCLFRMNRVLGNNIDSNTLRNLRSDATAAVTQDGAPRYGARHTLSLILDGMSRHVEELGSSTVPENTRLQIHGVLAMSLLLTELLLLQVVDSIPPPTGMNLEPERESLTSRIDQMCTQILQSRFIGNSHQLTRSLRLMRLTMRHAHRALDQTYNARRSAMLPRQDTDRRQLLGSINRCLRTIHRRDNNNEPQRNETTNENNDAWYSTINDLITRYSDTRDEDQNRPSGSNTNERAQSREPLPSNNDNSDGDDNTEPEWWSRSNNSPYNTSLYRTNNVNLVQANEVSNPPRPWNVPTVQVNDVPVSEPSAFPQRIMSHRQRFAERVSELRSNARVGLFRPRFLHPLYASVNPFDADLDDPQREQIYDSDMITTVTPNHRIQAWDISNWAVPAISNSLKNVVVSECKIHNDASVDIAKDGTILVTLLPSGGYLNVTNRLGVYSLRWETLGQCLYTTSFEQNAVSVSLSPLSRHLVVGFASRRVSIVPSDRWVMARIYKIEQKDVPGDRLPALRELEQSRESRINCIRWLPTSGQGLIYATNTGQLVILS